MNYKEKVKRGLYRNYFTNLHASEKDLEFTSTKIANKDILIKMMNTSVVRPLSLLDAGCGDGLFIKDAIKGYLKAN